MGIQTTNIEKEKEKEKKNGNQHKVPKGNPSLYWKLENNWRPISEVLENSIVYPTNDLDWQNLSD